MKSKNTLDLTNWPEISRHIWDVKYRFRRGTEVVDGSIEDSWRRVAKATAAQEADPARWEAAFYEALAGFRFLPGGRVLANAGTARDCTTMFNCYVMGTIQDSIEGIFDTVKESALTQKQGGGVGFDFSTIRPRGSHIEGVDSPASGPLSFMNVMDATCRTIMSAGQRRGAQMGIMRCDHPDIEDFIEAKRQDGVLRMFNLSVAVTDDFMAAVEADGDWDLVFGGTVYRTIKARGLWDKIMRSTYDFAEPGVFMVDRVNQLNNLSYCETIAATNPCGEQPLPPYGACLLGSLNLTRFVTNPFGKKAKVDLAGLAATTAVAVRFLDNVIEFSNYPLERQREEAISKRRMGLGITGLADMLIMLGLRYGSPEAAACAEEIMRTITVAAYGASADLAAERGAFPLFSAEHYLATPFIQQLPESVREKIARNGIRNSHLTSIAPTGTISLLAGNVSSGIEPVFAFHYVRRIREGQEDQTADHEVMDYAYAEYCRQFGRPSSDDQLPPAFVTADGVTPTEHIDMQAALQRHVDSSISKTINVPTDFPFDQFEDIYRQAYRKGLKGCTTFRPSEYITGVLIRKEEPEAPKPPTVDTPPRRPEVLHGTTYKVKTPLSKDAFYVTINDICEGEICRPYEIFVNTKNLQHYSWVVAMTRLISAVFRREPNPSFLVEELVSIYDPNGGYFSNGEYVPSLPAEIGRLLASHLRSLGIMPDTQAAAPKEEEAMAVSLAAAGPRCPMCNAPGLQKKEGCLVCPHCGFSKCG